MPRLDTIRNDELVKLAREHFDSELTDTELGVLRDSSCTEDPPEPDEAGPRPEVRAELIRWLATDPRTVPYIDPRGITVQGVTVTNQLDLTNCQVHSALQLKFCIFRTRVYFQSAVARRIDLLGSSFDQGIEAGWLVTCGSFSLHRVRSSARVGLIGAHIQGDLDCSVASLSPTNPAEEEAWVAALYEGTRGKGYFAGLALSADRATIDGAVFMQLGFASSGEISMVNAKIGSDLIFRGAKFSSAGRALSLWRAEIGGAVYFEDGFESAGRISLSSARIGGMVSCSGMKIILKREASNAGDHSAIQNSTGNATDHIALDLDGASVGDSVYFEDFESSGLIQMMYAHVKHEVSFDRAKLTSPGDSLWLGGSEIGTNLIFGDGFEAAGYINMHGASVGGDLRFVGAVLAQTSCTNMRMGGDFAWLGIRGMRPPSLDLSGTTLRKLRDDRASWPTEGSLFIDNLVYEDLVLQRSPTPKEIGRGHYSNELDRNLLARIQWLKRQPRDRQVEPQPWMQLANLLEAKGDHSGAKRVIREFQRVKARKIEWHPLRRFKGTVSTIYRALSLIVRSPKAVAPFGRHPNRFLALAFAWLEEAPSRIAYSIVTSVLIGWLIFAHANGSHAFAPTEPDAYKTYVADRPMPAAYPAFNSFAYTLENALPLVKLGQDDKWAPDPNHASKDWFTNYGFLMCARWCLILFGWFQASILAAVLASRFKP